MESLNAVAAGRNILVARWIFIVGGLYGVVMSLIMFFHTPAMMPKAPYQQPEMYYGFATLCFAWQMAFFLIAGDPIRYRVLMLLAAVFEKFGFVAALAVLLIQHHAGKHWIPVAGVDFVFGVGFLISYALTRGCDFLRRAC